MDIFPARAGDFTPRFRLLVLVCRDCGEHRDINYNISNLLTPPIRFSAPTGVTNSAVVVAFVNHAHPRGHRRRGSTLDRYNFGG